MLGISLSKPCQLDFPTKDTPDVMIEKENQRMRARKQSQRPRRLAIVKDTSLDNPTPQMVEIMNMIREKSASPPVCQKRHRHNRCDDAVLSYLNSVSRGVCLLDINVDLSGCLARLCY